MGYYCNNKWDKTILSIKKGDNCNQEWAIIMQSIKKGGNSNKLTESLLIEMDRKVSRRSGGAGDGGSR